MMGRHRPPVMLVSEDCKCSAAGMVETVAEAAVEEAAEGAAEGATVSGTVAAAVEMVWEWVPVV